MLGLLLLVYLRTFWLAPIQSLPSWARSLWFQSYMPCYGHEDPMCHPILECQAFWITLGLVLKTHWVSIIFANTYSHLSLSRPAALPKFVQIFHFAPWVAFARLESYLAIQNLNSYMSTRLRLLLEVLELRVLSAASVLGGGVGAITSTLLVQTFRVHWFEFKLCYSDMKSSTFFSNPRMSRWVLLDLAGDSLWPRGDVDPIVRSSGVCGPSFCLASYPKTFTFI